MSSKLLFSANALYNSDVCRLCGEKNSNGEFLYNEEDEENALGTLVNHYLPVKVRDDGKLPRTICPGCHIQLQATIQFFELLIKGQQKIREQWTEQRENEKKMAVGIASIPEVEGEDGNIYMMITVPNDKENLYADDDPITLKTEGLEKPRKKRGRPRKTEIEASEEQPIVQEPEPEIDADGKVKRRRRVPQRFLESVAGNDLDKVFRDHGVIEDDEKERVNILDHLTPAVKTSEVIGRTVTEDGKEIGDIVVLNKSRTHEVRFNSGKPRKKNQCCSVCKKSFPSRKLLLAHRQVYSTISMSYRGSCGFLTGRRIEMHSWKFECESCKEKFMDEVSVQTHQASLGHSGIIVLGLMKEGYNAAEEMNPLDFVAVVSELDADATEGQEVECPECQKPFISSKTLLVHIKAVHEGLCPYKCTLCSKEFPFPKSLGNHMENCHGTPDLNKNSEEPKRTGPYACDLCDKRFNHLSSVFYHKEAEHNDGIRFACNKCDKSFKHRQLLQRHQLVHTDDRPFVCTICSTSFKTKPNLTNHMLIHTGEKKYYCDLCGQQFAHKTSLVLHHRWHNGEKPFECKYCQKAFTQNGNLQEHLRIHTGEKPYLCNFCQRRFTTSSQFKLHVKRHTGDRPWKCEFCSKTFLHKDTWKCHVRRHKGEKPYSCDFCERGFTEQWALRKHIRIHTGEKPYVCEICNKAFADCSNLNKHKKVHRGLTAADMKEDEGGVMLQLVGEEDENGTVPVIYVAYNQQGEDENPSDHQTSIVNQDGSVLQQISGGDTTGIVLSTEDGQEVIINTLGADIPMVVPQSQLRMSEAIGSSGATLQMQSTEDGMSLPVTLAVEDGQLVAHIPTSSEFIKENDQSQNRKMTTKEVPPVQFQLVTQDGRAVQLISNATDSTAAFSIDFTEEN